MPHLTVSKFVRGNTGNEELKKIGKSYELDYKLVKMSEQQSFFTIKDHEEDFITNPKYRLLKPSKRDWKGK